MSAEAQPLTDIEYKLLLVSYIHSLPEDALNKGRVISFLFAAAGPVGNNPSSMPHLLKELAVESIGELEEAVNGFALSAKRGLLVALKRTRTSILNALPPDFPSNSKEEADVMVKPVLASLAKKVQALQEAAKDDSGEVPAAPPVEGAPPVEKPKKKPVQVRAMIWQPPIQFTFAEKLGRGDKEQLALSTPFDGDIVLGAGALMYRLIVQGDAVRIQHYEMYGEHRADEDVVLPLGQRFVIGRGAKADHRRPDQDADAGSRGLSRMHVAVTIQRDAKGGPIITLEDLGSTNGTPVWWNGPQGVPPARMEHHLELKRGGAQQSLDQPFSGDAWISAGSMLYRIQAVGGAVRVTHHGEAADASGDQPTDHLPGRPFRIGRDPNVEHPVAPEHPGATGLSRQHATIQVTAVDGVIRLQVNDHSSNGTTVWWNAPPGANPLG
jgi:hypothetical protein